MRRAIVPAVCLLVLLVSSASSQSFANNRAQTISNIFQSLISSTTPSYPVTSPSPRTKAPISKANNLGSNSVSELADPANTSFNQPWVEINGGPKMVEFEKKKKLHIPIQTLTAISNFAQNTRPLGEIIQRRRSPQIQQSPQTFSYVSTQSFPINSPRSRAAKIAGVYTAADGSGFRI